MEPDIDGSGGRLVLRVVHMANNSKDSGQKLSYRNQQAMMRGKFSGIAALACNQILDTMERGVMYPILCLDWSPGHDAADHCERIKDDFYHPDLYMLQGLFEEVKRIEPVANKERISCLPSTFIVLGYKFVEKSFHSVLLNTWRDWTGARHIYLNLKNEFNLRRIVFFQRLSPQTEVGLFTFLLLVEINDVTDHNVLGLLDFVQSMRTRKMPGYLSLYRETRPFDIEKRRNYLRQRQVATILQNPRECAGLPHKIDIILPVNWDHINRRNSQDSLDDEYEDMDDPFFTKQVSVLEEAMTLVQPEKSPEQLRSIPASISFEEPEELISKSNMMFQQPERLLASSKLKDTDEEEAGRFTDGFRDNIRTCLTFQTRQ